MLIFNYITKEVFGACLCFLLILSVDLSQQAPVMKAGMVSLTVSNRACFTGMV